MTYDSEFRELDLRLGNCELKNRRMKDQLDRAMVYLIALQPYAVKDGHAEGLQQLIDEVSDND